MRVMTMSGGFRGLHGARGLGALTDGQRSQARLQFMQRVEQLDVALDRVLDAGDAGLLPRGDYDRLVDSYHALGARISAHLNTVQHLSSDRSLASWRTVSEEIVGDVNRWVGNVRRVIGDERGGRAPRIALLVAGGTVLFGGAALVIWRSSR